MFVSGFAAGMSQRISGKYLLMPGLMALAAGSAYIDWAAHAGSGRWDFLPGLIVSGAGMGCIWIPLFSVGTRDLPAHLAGVASGVINTIQEVGAVLASAVVGAFLQNRLALALHDRAVTASGGLPTQYRAQFVDGFSNVSRTGFEVGAGQAGANLNLPAQVAATAHSVFTNAFVDAMHPTLVLPIVALVLAATATLFIRTRTVAVGVEEQVAAVA
jgi:hypothetical protein